jgi:hypothetical protein|tara:strand:+ start:971 stop:1330 length:360 start_codon:yes stop_codon:yes gene_type:complete
MKKFQTLLNDGQIKTGVKMARPYSDKFLLGLQYADQNKLGIQLAQLCVKSNLPTMYLSDIFKVSRQSVHNWFRGKPIRKAHQKLILEFMVLVELDLKNNVLPAHNLANARQYASDWSSR